MDAENSLSLSGNQRSTLPRYNTFAKILDINILKKSNIFLQPLQGIPIRVGYVLELILLCLAKKLFMSPTRSPIKLLIDGFVANLIKSVFDIAVPHALTSPFGGLLRKAVQALQTKMFGVFGAAGAGR
jgi:hypothetical protein